MQPSPYPYAIFRQLVENRDEGRRVVLEMGPEPCSFTSGPTVFLPGAGDCAVLCAAPLSEDTQVVTVEGLSWNGASAEDYVRRLTAMGWRIRMAGGSVDVSLASASVSPEGLSCLEGSGHVCVGPGDTKLVTAGWGQRVLVSEATDPPVQERARELCRVVLYEPLLDVDKGFRVGVLQSPPIERLGEPRVGAELRLGGTVEAVEPAPMGGAVDYLVTLEAFDGDANAIRDRIRRRRASGWVLVAEADSDADPDAEEGHGPRVLPATGGPLRRKGRALPPWPPIRRSSARGGPGTKTSTGGGRPG